MTPADITHINGLCEQLRALLQKPVPPDHRTADGHGHPDFTGVGPLLTSIRRATARLRPQMNTQHGLIAELWRRTYERWFMFADEDAVDESRSVGEIG